MALISSSLAIVGTLFVSGVTQLWTRSESQKERQERVFSKLMGIAPVYIEAKAAQMDAQVTVQWSAARCALEVGRPIANENIKMHQQFVDQERGSTAAFLAVQRDLHEEIGEAAMAFKSDRKLAPLLAVLANAYIPAPTGDGMGTSGGPATEESIDRNAKALRKQISPFIVEQINVPFKKVLDEIGNQLGVDDQNWSADSSIVMADGGT